MPADNPVYIKDPSARLPYMFDWNDWLEGETIASRVTTIPAGLEQFGSIVQNATNTIVTVIGGTPGKDYIISDTITTTPSARVDTRRITIRVRNR